MQTVVICNQKGGVGKSVIADHLAWSMERTGTPYSFYDLDGQGGVIHETKENPDASVNIVDTPGALQPEMKNWISNANCIVVPTRASATDMKPLLRMADLLEDAHCPVIYILNFWNRYSAAQAFEQWFKETFGNALVLKLPQSEMIAQAMAFRQSVVEYAPKAPVTRAMTELTDSVRKHIGLETEL